MSPDRFCDIVMKGGITSGVVYPQAVLELSEHYRFKSVGGTSAGAIAAAATAAAEHDRDGGGFDKLKSLPGWIGRDDNLKSLFQAQKPMRGVFGLLLAAISPGGKKRLPFVALRWYPLPALLGAVPGGLLTCAALDASPDWLKWVAVVLGVLAGLAGAAAAVAVWMAWRVSRALPDCFYGMCAGMEGHRSKREALTPWLADLIDRYAGRTEGPEEPPRPNDPPLTFGELWSGQNGVVGDPDKPAVRLEMMTTNVTNRTAERLPWATREFMFDEGEMRRLFPKRVVDHMIAKAQQIDDSRTEYKPLLPLPDPQDLPVIVATRMSLSFPVLLGAVPLWRVMYFRKATGMEPRAERCWFSDGGVSSNFPVHFFDAPLPRHPTFAINLRPPRQGETVSEDDQRKNIEMQDKVSQKLPDWWYLFETKKPFGFDTRIAAFLSGVVRTMQNRVDEAQMRVPGYRERVLHMTMSDKEGGMNLAMPKEVLEGLSERGRCAGQRMVEQFHVGGDDEKAVSWDAHRWVRLRTTLLAECDFLTRFADGYDAETAAGAQTFTELINRPEGAPPNSYPLRGQPRRALAEDMTGRIDALVEALKAAHADDVSLDERAPNPRPAVRVVPQEAPLRQTTAPSPDDED